MRWRSGRKSSNVEDRRGGRAVRRAAGGGIGVIIIALVAMFLGVDPSTILNLGSSISTSHHLLQPSRPFRRKNKN